MIACGRVARACAPEGVEQVEAQEFQIKGCCKAAGTRSFDTQVLTATVADSHKIRARTGRPFKTRFQELLTFPAGSGVGCKGSCSVCERALATGKTKKPWKKKEKLEAALGQFWCVSFRRLQASTAPLEEMRRQPFR
ncbi:unnamed protein product [Ectocarpus sp. 12 AP-2014]